MEIRLLRKEDDRSLFTCGNDDLDRFFRTYAGQNQFKHHIGNTYVAVEGAIICGYATISSGHIEISDLPETLKKKLPRYPLPILRLARLAVASNVHGKGIGGELLYAMLRLAIHLDEKVGCFGVVVDAKPQAIGWYSRYGFISMPVLEGASAARPMQTPMFLSLATIRAAVQTKVTQKPVDDRSPVKLRTFRGQGLRPGADLDESAALEELMDRPEAST